MTDLRDTRHGCGGHSAHKESIISIHAIQLLFLAGIFDEGRSWSLFRLFCPLQSLSLTPPSNGRALILSHLSLLRPRMCRESGPQRAGTKRSSCLLAHSGGGKSQRSTSSPIDEPLRHPSCRAQSCASTPGPQTCFRLWKNMAPPSHPPRFRAIDPHRGQRIATGR